MSRFDCLYLHFKATKTEKLSQVSTPPDDIRDNSVTDRDYKETLVEDKFQGVDIDVDNISEGLGNPQTAWDSEKSGKVSQMSHARENIKRVPQLFIKDNTLFNSLFARESDKRDTFETNNNTPPDDCENCPAGAKWEWKSIGMWCFYSAYFLGKSAKPIPCFEASQNCQLKNDLSSASGN